MGRVRRQRRYKSCDPFSQSKRPDIKYDKPPKKCEVDDFEETKSFHLRQKLIDRAMKKKTVEGGLKHRPQKKGRAECMPGIKPKETQKEYFRRLDERVQLAVNKTMVESRTLRKKRKIHLKARDEKLKKKRKHKEETNLLKDVVAFGEVAMQPPIITSLPRRAVKEKVHKDLQLSSLLRQNIKYKHMSGIERQKLENERQKAIDAYRLLKKRKSAGD